jgi:hypothetical protein
VASADPSPTLVCRARPHQTVLRRPFQLRKRWGDVTNRTPQKTRKRNKTRPPQEGKPKVKRSPTAPNDTAILWRNTAGFFMYESFSATTPACFSSFGLVDAASALATMFSIEVPGTWTLAYRCTRFNDPLKWSVFAARAASVSIADSYTNTKTLIFDTIR